MLLSLVIYTAWEQKDLIARESDTDKDRMISYDEFLAETKRDEFEKASQNKDNSELEIVSRKIPLVAGVPFYLLRSTNFASLVFAVPCTVLNCTLYTFSVHTRERAFREFL